MCKRDEKDNYLMCIVSKKITILKVITVLIIFFSS